MSCVLVLLGAIVVWLCLSFEGFPYSPFISKGVGVTRKVSELVTIVVQVGHNL
jgi:hypothetical protein